MTPALQPLLDRSRGPTGQPRQVDLGVERGPLAELADLLSAKNGFFVFNAGIQIYRAGEPGLGPELQEWNTTEAWKDNYGGLADGLFCVGQDLFGRQFAIDNRHTVVVFDPETAERIPIGESLEAWAAWLWEDPDVNGTRAYATAWQDEHGALTPDQRLIPLRFFILGGSYDFDNVAVKDARTCMRIRGPIAQTINQSADRTVLYFQ
ncbi:SMI1/KNR4 family protein [Amycolatopsis pigmentata]|uniref:SMI1/KNR4 family protein n=1 Tax=Amycolatopsis pigmentata TaxID=450801 RepID=A0ABW5G825_9PSEU